MSENGIESLFAQRRAAGRAALMPFLTAGYPDLETTAALLPALERAGATVCEIGLPFSDPIADGPVIASSMHEALQRGVRLADVFAMVRAARKQTGMGLAAMVSWSIVHRRGARNFIEQCADCGFDGLIFPDLPLEESDEARSLARSADLTCSLLVAPTTPPPRAAAIARACTGFVYLLARTGITGVRDEAPEIGSRVKMLREATDLPIACGFGIGSAEAVRAVTAHADAAIVGSAIVRRLGEFRQAPPTQRVEAVESFVRDLAAGLAPRPIPA